jgi:hypothetical protein
MLAAEDSLAADFSSKLGKFPLAVRALTRHAVPWLDRASAQLEVDLPLLEAALGKVDRTLSLREIRARVLEVRDETHDVKTFVLRPNARFPAYRPGSYVTLRLSIAGRALERSYSLSSAPAQDGLIAFTVKRVPGGLASNWISDNVRAGDVLALSAPAGQFVLPRELPSKLVMISAGSGITPVMSMLRQLVAERAATQIVFMHFARRAIWSFTTSWSGSRGARRTSSSRFASNRPARAGRRRADASRRRCSSRSRPTFGNCRPICAARPDSCAA